MRGATIFLVLIFTSQGLCSQSLAHRDFTVRDGLIQSQVDKFYFDSRGYLWIATRGGVSCFNGEAIKNYPSADQGLGNRILSIAEDTAGYIYFIDQYGLVRLDGVQADRIHTSSNSYTYMDIDAQNRIWLYRKIPGSYESGIDVFDLGNDLKKVVPPVLNIDSSFNNENGIFFDNSGPERHILSQDIDDNWRVRTSTYESREISAYEALTYFLDEYTDGVQPEFEFEHQIPDLLERNPDVLDSFMLMRAIPSFMDSKYQKPRRRLSYIDNEKDELVQLDLKTGRAEGFDIGWDNYFYRYYIDALDRIWVGREHGFSQLFNPFAIEYNHKLLDLSWSIIDLGGDSLIFASIHRDLVLKHEDQYESISLSCIDDRLSFYMGAKKLSDGRIMLTGGHGLVILNNNLQCIEKIPKNQVENTTVTTQDLAVNKGESRALAAVFGGINLYNIERGATKLIRKIPFDKKSFRNRYANSVCIDSRGDYWVGHEKGLSIYDPRQEQWTNYSSADETFPAGDVATIYQDKRRNYWMGTANGLVFGEGDGTFRRIDDPLIYGVVNAVDSFDQNHLILGGTFGLCLLDLNAWYEDGAVRGKIFNDSNGFMAGEPAENAIYRMEDGSLMIGTQSWPVRIYPDRMDRTVRPLRTRILFANDSMLPFTEPNPSITLPHRTDDVRIDFEAIGMYRPMQETMYSYRLNGGDWSEWQEERFVEFSDLGTGDHTFQLRAQTPGIDPEKQTGSTLAFATSVPIWQEPFFPAFLGISLVVAVLILVLLALNNYYQRRRNLRYATQIDYLRNQSIQSQMNPHFVFNILGTLQNMILQSDVKRANRQLVNLSTLIRRFLESTVQGNLPDGQAAIREQSLEKEIELLKLYIEFEQVQHKDLFDYTIDIDPDLDPANFYLPPMLIQPFVENAIKHGLLNKEGPGHLSLSFSLTNGHLQCIVEDDGVGRKRARKIKSQSMQADRSYGTELVRERIELLNKLNYRIDCTIEDSEGGGTKVTLKIGS